MGEEVLGRELEIELARSRRYENPFALLRLTVTDDQGQVPGAELLHRLGGSLRLAVRWSDSIGREADNQYLILLRETQSRGASIAADKLQVAIREDLAVSAESLCFRVQTAAWRKGDHLGALLERLAR